MKLSTKVFAGFFMLAIVSSIVGVIGYNGITTIIELDQKTYPENLSAEEEKQILEEESEKISGVIVLVSSMSIIIAIGFGLYFSTLIGIPLKKLEITAKEIGKGNLNAKFRYDKDDEIGEFAKTFNLMTDSLKKIIELEKELIISKQQITNERFTAIGELSARISHDIRNPLSILHFEFQLLKHKKIIDKKQIKRIDTSMKRISHQIDEVLDYVRTTPLQYTKFSLNDVVSQSLDSVTIPSEVKINISSDIIHIKADKHKIEIIMINLILNAVQAVNDEGTIDVTLYETSTETIIGIIDSGDGITVEPLDKIFDPLITTKQQGTGLGLASVKNIVEQHNGTISVKNNPTTFIIKLPKKERMN